VEVCEGAAVAERRFHRVEKTLLQVAERRCVRVLQRQSPYAVRPASCLYRCIQRFSSCYAMLWFCRRALQRQIYVYPICSSFSFVPVYRCLASLVSAMACFSSAEGCARRQAPCIEV
jgi:hypothetical protein